MVGHIFEAYGLHLLGVRFAKLVDDTLSLMLYPGVGVGCALHTLHAMEHAWLYLLRSDGRCMGIAKCAMHDGRMLCSPSLQSLPVAFPKIPTKGTRYINFVEDAV